MRRGVANSALHLGQLVLDDRLDARARAQDVEIVGDLGGELVELVGDLVAAERGQALQAQVEDGARLLVGQPVGAVGDRPGGADRRSARSAPRRRRAGQSRAIKASRASLASCEARISRMTSSILATAMARPTRIWARSRALLSRKLVRREMTSSRKATKACSMSFRFISSGRPPLSATMLTPKVVCSGGEAVELVEHDVGHRVALQLDHDAIAVAVGLVAQVGDALDLLLAHQFGDALDHRRLVHLIGNLGDDDRLAVLAQLLDLDLAAHDDRAAAGVVGGADAGAAEDDAAGREIRARHDLDQLVDARAPGSSISAMQASITSPRLCGGMLVAMPTAMPPAPLTRRFGKARRQDRSAPSRCRRSSAWKSTVSLSISSSSAIAGLGEAALGVAHGRRRIAVDRAEIALPVDQRQAHGEVLRHAHQRVVDRLVAVRVVFAHHVADDARRLRVFLVGRVPLLVHRVEDAPVHRLQPVAHVGQRARHDHAHGVIEVGALHLVRDGHGADVGGAAVFRRLSSFSANREFPLD